MSTEKSRSPLITIPSCNSHHWFPHILILVACHAVQRRQRTCSLSSSGEEDRPQFAQEAKGIGLSAKDDMPEWRKASFGGKKVSYGKKTNLSILEQRQSLPIFKLRDELVKVRPYVGYITELYFVYSMLYKSLFS